VPDIDAIVDEVDRELPDIARAVIRRHLNWADPATRRFLEEPDAREHHQSQWHQWGIITHTRVFLEDFDTQVPRYLREWGLWDAVSARLQEPMDGVAKWQLLRITILLHDIGKFGARRMGRSRYHFANHEVLSGEIILHELDLAHFGLTEPQIRYIARTASDHFVLGLIRKRAREQGNYNLEFVDSPEFAELSRQIKEEHTDDFVEIGVLYLGDSLAKAHPPEGPERALSQYELNAAVAHRYLEIVLRG
jgi:hypothetical protein